MKVLSTIKRFFASKASRVAVVAVVALGAVGYASMSYGVQSSTAGCLDGSRYQSFRVTYQSRTTGTLTTVDGKPLCKDAPMIFQSYSFAPTWNGNTDTDGFLSSLPQTSFGETKFVFPGKKANYRQTVTVKAPDACKPTQIDFYVGSAPIKVIPKDNPRIGWDREVRSGKIFKPEGKCVYECVSISRIKQDNPAKYVFRGKASTENGPKAVGFTFEFGDGKSKYVAVQRTEGKYSYADAPYTYAKSGTYNVKVTAHITYDGKEYRVTSDDCQKPVTIKIPTPPAPEPPKPAPVAECVSLTGTRIGAKSFRLNATAHVANGATIKAYSFTVKNVPAPGHSTDPIYFNKTVTTSASTASVATGELTRLQAGQTYQASVAVNTSEGLKTGGNCIIRVTTEKPTPAPEMVEVCDLKDKTVKKITKEEYEANKDRYTTDLDKCKEQPTPEPVYIDVCRLEDKEYPVRIKEEDFNPELHSKNPEDCKEAPAPEPTPEPTPEPEKDVVVCNPETGEIITVKESEADKYVDKDSDECKEKEEPTPVKSVVKELPKTGLAEQLSGIFGLGALTTALYYYVSSRRN